MRSHIYILIFLFIAVSGKSAEKFNYTFDSATVDLTNWEIDKNIALLGGDALFFRDTFVFAFDPNDKQFGVYLNTLKTWDNQSRAYTKFDTKGYGTYCLQLKLPENLVGNTFIIKPNHFISYASEIYVNKKLVASNGSVGIASTDSNYQASRNTVFNPFVADTNLLSIVIWVSNYDHFRGGIFNSIEFGLAKHVIKEHNRAILFDLLIIVSLLIMFLYHFVLFFVNRQDHTALYFSLTCLIFAIDFSLQDTMSFFLLFPKASFTVSSVLQLSMPYLLPSSFIFFLHSLFPNASNVIVRNISGVVSITLTLFTVFLGANLTSVIAKPHFLYVGILILYVYWVSIKAVIQDLEGSVLFLVAYLVFSLCAINDILYVFEVIHTPSLVSAGLMVFVFLLSVLQGNRTLTMYRRNKKLSDTLQEFNLTLEMKVRERTMDLNETLQKVKKLNLFKEDMTNMLVHDLKAPLSTVISVKHLNNEGGLNLVQQAGYRMLNLVQNILAVYKYESTNMVLNKTEVTLNEIVNSAIEEVQLLIEQKALQVIIEFPENAKSLVDEDLIRRVFVNLLSNAIKFSPEEGKVHIKLDFNGSTSAISVFNQGDYIPLEKQKLIFERFGQSEKKSTGNVRSTGLGLTFCKMVIEAHGGKIGVNSVAGKDVEFWFTLPDSVCTAQLKEASSLNKNFNTRLFDDEKVYLKPYIEGLSRLKVFEITAIKAIVSKIEKKSTSVKDWVCELEKAAFAGDEQKYKELIDIKV